MSVLAIRPASNIALAPQPTTSSTPVWLSAQEIADACLPGLPRIKRKVNKLAERERWAFKVAADGSELARTRSGRGGGLEYHVDLLPPQARAKVLEQYAPTASACPVPTEDAANDAVSQIWSWYDSQPLSTKAKAERNLAIIGAVKAAQAGGQTRTAAVAIAAANYGVSAASIGKWLTEVAGIAPHDWLPHLAPRYVGGGKAAEVDHDIWIALISDYLRLEEPTWESCYYRAKRIARAAGIEIPSSRTLYRKMEREIDPLVRVKRRKGRDALQRTMPPQIRSVEALHAMERVNIDGHKWDVFVRWKNGTVIRPMMVAIQDVYSRKLLAWRFDESENVHCARLAFKDLIEKYGIPKVAHLDNSRAFAAKPLTGGVKKRNRFKVDPNEPLGLLPMLGVQVLFATPYHGQAKPIERYFRDVAHNIADCPEFAGAYTGHNPMAKPENYDSAAVDYETFIAVANREIHALNARLGRRTEMANGKSFDAVFAESYANAKIGKAKAEHLRMAMLTAERLRTHRKDGSIKLFGNQYWSSDLSAIPATPVIVRYDPERLHSEVHVFDMNEKFVGVVPIWDARGFGSAAAAHEIRKLRRDHRKAVAEEEAKYNLRSAAELAASMPALIEPDLPEPSVIRPVRHRGQTAAALKPRLEIIEAPINEPKKPAAIDRLADAHAKLKLVD